MLQYYKIQVDGQLDITWRDWLGVLELRHDGQGSTSLLVGVEDQPALHGILTRIRDLNLELVALKRLDTNGLAILENERRLDQ